MFKRVYFYLFGKSLRGFIENCYTETMHIETFGPMGWVTTRLSPCKGYQILNRGAYLQSIQTLHTLLPF